MMQPPVPELCSVTVYQQRGPVSTQQDDIFIEGNKVTVLGADAAARQSEFEFDAVFGPDKSAFAASKDPIESLVHTASCGTNGLLLVLGGSGSGKSALAHGLPTSSAAAEPGGEGGFNGVVERCVRAMCALIPPPNADASLKLTLSFLNVTEERVQDVLRADSHAQNLPLAHTPSVGVVATGESVRELNGEQMAVQLYRQGRSEISRLTRHHGMDAAAACNLLTLTLTRTPPAEPSGPLGAAPRTDASGVLVISSLTVVELPATERLDQERSELRVTLGPHTHLGIIHFDEVTPY